MQHTPNQTKDFVIVITTGRMMFTETARNLFDAIYRFGRPIAHYQCPYWAQSIQNAMELAVAHKPKYLLHFDGDSVWDQDDLETLYQLIDRDDSIDAIQACMADRNGPKPLAYNWCAEVGVGYNYNEGLCQILHGHFGMTFIRAASLLKMSKPWFWSTPGQHGLWSTEDGKRDDDTNFWTKFSHTGLRLVQANHTVVGHMELHIRWQQGANVVVQTPAEFRANGKPYGLRAPRPEELKALELPAQQPMPVPVLQALAKQQEAARAAAQPIQPVQGDSPPAAQAPFPIPPEPVAVGDAAPSIVDSPRITEGGGA